MARYKAYITIAACCAIVSSLAACDCNSGWGNGCNNTYIYYPPYPGVGDGANPNGMVAGGDGNYYGTTANGGNNGQGAFFRVTPAGVETTLYSFAGGGTDGADPEGLIQGTDGNFYGATNFGGNAACISGCGTVFRITPAGVETVLYFFGGAADGGDPNGVVEGSDGNFYGTASYGGLTNGSCGASGCGVIFRLTPAGGESVLYSFPGGANGVLPVSLIQGTDGNFYGTTVYGGQSNNGTVFKVAASGAQTVLHSFSGGSDGQLPQQTQLIEGSDGNFYGTTPYGGTNSRGVVYRITPAGAETVLYSFAGGTTDGALPGTALVENGGNLYGTTNAGGSADCAGGCGTVFKLTPAGVESVLFFFGPSAISGAQPPNPSGLLVALNYPAATGDLAGITTNGGRYGVGSVFSLTSAGTAAVLYSFGTNNP
ncbi:MAG: choice-of-anchor tandem repeat GloVer-containing protein [Steroidobacteraceae bacterium]